MPYLTLRMLRARRQKKFGAQFADAIDIIVRSLRAGHPVPIAVAMVARETARSDRQRIRHRRRRGHLRRRSRDGDAQSVLPRRPGRPAAVRHRGRDPGLDRRQSRRDPRRTCRRSFASASRCGARSRRSPPKARASALILSALPVGMFAIIQFVVAGFLRQRLEVRHHQDGARHGGRLDAGRQFRHVLAWSTSRFDADADRLEPARHAARTNTPTLLVTVLVFVRRRHARPSCVMAALRVRGAVRRRAAGITGESARSGGGRHDSLRAVRHEGGAASDRAHDQALFDRSTTRT